MVSSVDTSAAFGAIPLDKTANKPIYVQIAEGVASLLARGTFPVGCILPTERALCEQYGVSRMTLRQAMSVLERQGLIESHRGRGTFVAPKRMQKQQQEFRSFSEEIRLRGGNPQSRLISFEVFQANAITRDFFGLRHGESVYEIRRVRMKDKTPLALETAQVPERLAPHLDRFDFAKNSLYQVLEESYGLRLETSIEEISAGTPSLECRKVLQIPKTTAVLVVNRKTYTDVGQAIELTESIYRGDLYSAMVHSVRQTKNRL